MAGHESARTTGLYDRRNDTVALDRWSGWCIEPTMPDQNQQTELLAWLRLADDDYLASELFCEMVYWYRALF